ncbi:Stage V sporulation protein AA [Paraliobacillus sp. PM-2]|uniref:stage V sporulation protein AA n=1 Tax=Paraliobacillus sp. PM-2 TaxID=1462524 RepID=UPI00061CA51F|nr:stage V sporulation protein AA [Paraliobacillus sp. PM-2]CQR46742.1 Stage V sporulation protein AA [Paraliobacillus sp. PM-2]
MQNNLYMRLKKYVYIKPPQAITVRDVAFLTGPEELVSSCNQIIVQHQTKAADKIRVIEALTIIQIIQQYFPNVDIQLLGPNQCIIHKSKKKQTSKLMLVLLVWLLLFIGSAMAIMNFHYDVSMQSVQQRLHYLITGEEAEFPLWLQIPYSIGLGLGMVLFFNYLFKKRLNDEPSPMEIEMYKYQQDIDQYVQYYENPLNQKSNDKS